MRHSFFVCILALCATMLLCACQSKEERVISKIQNLTEKVEQCGDKMSAEDWNQLQQEYVQLHDEIANGDYHFSDQQMEQLGKAEGKFAAACVEHGFKEVGKGINKALKAGVGFLKGLTGEE